MIMTMPSLMIRMNILILMEMVSETMQIQTMMGTVSPMKKRLLTEQTHLLQILLLEIVTEMVWLM